MRPSLLAGLVGLLGLALPAAPARALQFEQVTISPTEVIVGGQGPIVKGDTERLEQALAAVPQTRRMLALALDSPGGNVVEGEQLAKLIRARGVPVVIPSNSKCVSACFLLLAASPRRLAAADALVPLAGCAGPFQAASGSLPRRRPWPAGLWPRRGVAPRCRDASRGGGAGWPWHAA